MSLRVKVESWQIHENVMEHNKPEERATCGPGDPSKLPDLLAGGCLPLKRYASSPLWSAAQFKRSYAESLHSLLAE